MAFKHLRVRRDGAVEHIALNRPEVRNAFNEDLIGELASWASQATLDPELRAVVLSGEGPSFCAGADLAWMAKMASYTEADNLRDAAAAARMFAALDQLPVPVIARVHGAALGGGAGLAAVADIAVAAEGATFGFTEVRLGLLPAVIAPYVLAKIGLSAARELFLTGRRFDADRALRIGLVHAVVPADQLDRVVQEYVDDLLAGSREAIAAAKALLRSIAALSIEEAMPFTVEAIARRRTSPDAQERMRAFLKRS
jgi:methylglutaconyl-CoA hydratase